MNYNIGESVWIVPSPEFNRDLHDIKAYIEKVVGKNLYNILFDKDAAIRRTQLIGFKNIHAKHLTNKNPFIKA
jgi:hypothetical protein